MVEVNRPLDSQRIQLGNKTVPTAATSAAATSAAKQAIVPAPKPAMESRLQQQQRYLDNMWSQLGQDARLASIMFNPIFMIHAQAITDAAVGVALHRYETELPQQDFGVLYRDEMGKARQAILGLPTLYEQQGARALQVTGEALLSAYDTTSTAVVTAAKYSGNAFMSGLSAIGGFFAGIGRGIAHGIGHVLHGIGAVLVGAGGSLEKVGN